MRWRRPEDVGRLDVPVPEPVAGIGEGVGAASLRGDRMVYVQFGRRLDLNILPTPNRRVAVGRPEPEVLIASSQIDSEPAYSPDGRRIAFDSQVSGSFDIYVIDAEGGKPRRLTHEPSEENVGIFSRDGAWIYFSSNRTGRYETWKMPAEAGEAVQVTQNGGSYAQESWDGRDVYFYKGFRDGAIWRLPVEGGEEDQVLRGPDRWDSWTLSENGIYFSSWKWKVRWRSVEYAIEYFDLASGQVTEILRTEESVLPGRLAVSPDEQSILYTEAPLVESELMLVERFR
jgi:dipeptidyl aminopeptidase/acylaminoacyl peptidase